MPRSHTRMVLLVQRFEQRAMMLPVASAGHNQRPARRPHPTEALEPLIDVGDLGLGGRSYLLARNQRIVSEPQKLLHFIELEAQFLRALDEADAPDRIGRILAIPGRASRWLVDQATALVEPQRLDVDAGEDRHFANAESLRGHRFAHREACTLYRAIGSSPESMGPCCFKSRASWSRAGIRSAARALGRFHTDSTMTDTPWPTPTQRVARP